MKPGVEDWGKLHGDEALKLVFQRYNDGWDSSSAREQPKGSPGTGLELCGIVDVLSSLCLWSTE